MFINDSEEPVEATYQFPTDSQTVVSRLHFQLGDRSVEGRVQSKEKAQERYDDALAGGNAAVLVKENEKDKDLLEMKVGGIQPAQEVTVTLTLLKLLEVEAGAYCLRVPTSYFLRSGGEEVNKNIPKDAAVPPQDAEYSFRVEINAQQKVTYVSVPSHALVSKVAKEQAQPQAGH